MSKYLISVQETYRADCESEATALIEEAKNASEYTLANYNCEYKEVKATGEVVDDFYKVVLQKVFTDLKDPGVQFEISYEEQA